MEIVPRMIARDGFDPTLVPKLNEDPRRTVSEVRRKGLQTPYCQWTRSPVEARLAAASAALNSAVASSRPGLAPLDTQADAEDSDDHATEKMRSPGQRDQHGRGRFDILRVKLRQASPNGANLCG